MPTHTTKKPVGSCPPGVELLESRDLLSSLPLGSLLVRVKPGANADLPSLARDAAGRHAQWQSTDIPGLFTVSGAGDQLERLRGQYAHDPAVQYVETSQAVHAALAANDPRFVSGVLWGLNGPNGINVGPAWDLTT